VVGQARGWRPADIVTSRSVSSFGWHGHRALSSVLPTLWVDRYTEAASCTRELCRDLARPSGGEGGDALLAVLSRLEAMPPDIAAVTRVSRLLRPGV